MIRPMGDGDVDAAYRCDSIAMAGSAGEEERVRARTEEDVAARLARYRHLIEHDPGGAWIAVDGERAVGSALALRREGVKMAGREDTAKTLDRRQTIMSCVFSCPRAPVTVAPYRESKRLETGSKPTATTRSMLVRAGARRG